MRMNQLGRRLDLRLLRRDPSGTRLTPAGEELLVAARPVLSRLAVTDDLESGRLVEVAVTGVNLTRNIRAIWVSDTTLGPLARRLLRVAGHPRAGQRERAPALTRLGPYLGATG